MASPATAAATTTVFSTSVTTMAVNMPGSISAGDYLIAGVGIRNNGTFTLPSGWTLLDTQLGGGAVSQASVFYKVASGSEGSTQTWTAGLATTAAWHVFKITGADTTTLPFYAKTNGDSVAVDPPSVTPPWGSGDNLYIAFVGSSANTMNFTGAPSSYTGLTSSTASSGGGASNAGSAYRQLTAGTENPGTFTVSQNRWWAAFTIVVKPVSTGTRQTLTVDGAGNTTSGWMAEGGDYTRLQSDDGDTTRLYSPTSTDVFQVSLTDTSGLTGKTINKILVHAKVKSLDPVSNTIQIGVRTHSTDYYGSTKDTNPDNASYVDFIEEWATNPNTGAAWTIAELDALQMGLKKTNSAGMRWTYAYVEVDYSDGGSTGQIKVYVGGSFSVKPVKVYNGSTFVTKPLKVYNGSSWVATNY